jgi:putative transcriptional regulator
MSRIYKSEAMAAVHELMEGFHQSGAIDPQSMRDFDEACLTPVFSPSSSGVSPEDPL